MKYILMTMTALLVALAAAAQNTSMVLDRAIEALGRSGGITATYTLSGNDGTVTGRVAMRGNRFAMLSDNAKCWFDGKTQWAFSTMTGEVNITEPTADELQMTNPISTLRAAKSEFVATRADVQEPGCVTLRLTPKQRTTLRSVVMSFDSTSSLPVKAVISTTDGRRATLSVTNIKTRQKLPDSTFKFDKRLVPDGTPVVDLR